MEIGFAVVTGAVAGVAAFLLCASPALWAELPAAWLGP